MARRRPFRPEGRGRPRVDDRRVPSGIVDATALEARRTASSLRSQEGAQGRGAGASSGAPGGGLTSTLRAVAEARGRPLAVVLSAGDTGDGLGARALPESPPPRPRPLIGDRGCDAGWRRDALTDKGPKPCIPGRGSRGPVVLPSAAAPAAPAAPAGTVAPWL